MPVSNWDENLPPFTRALESLIGEFDLHSELGVTNRALAINIGAHMDSLYFLKCGQQGWLGEQSMTEGKS